MNAQKINWKLPLNIWCEKGNKIYSSKIIFKNRRWARVSVEFDSHFVEVFFSLDGKISSIDSNACKLIATNK